MNRLVMGPLIFLLIYVAFLCGRFLKDKPEMDVISPREYARVGIEAGINACMTRGCPSNRVELDGVRHEARTLIERIYTDVKWEWPPLETKLQGVEASIYSNKTYEVF